MHPQDKSSIILILSPLEYTTVAMGYFSPIDKGFSKTSINNDDFPYCFFTITIFFILPLNAISAIDSKNAPNISVPIGTVI